MQGAALRGAESSASDIARIPPSVARLHKALLIAPAQDKVATLLSRQKAERSPMRSHREDRALCAGAYLDASCLSQAALNIARISGTVTLVATSPN